MPHRVPKYLRADIWTSVRYVTGRSRRRADVVLAWVLGTGVVVLLSVAGGAYTLRRQIVAPLGRLAGDVGSVAHGDYAHAVRGSGALEVVQLGEDVEALRAH